MLHPGRSADTILIRLATSHTAQSSVSFRRQENPAVSRNKKPHLLGRHDDEHHSSQSILCCSGNVVPGTLRQSSGRANFDGPVLRAIEGGEDFWLATDAYIYGYPLVTMEMTRRDHDQRGARRAHAARWGNSSSCAQYPDASFRDVTAPNADTLYTTAWLDVGKEPWVLSIPDMKDRYFLLPMLDGWTNVFQVPGKRTTGTGAQTYAITGPGWKGTLPAGRQGIQIADQHRLDPRAHLLHRHAGRLRRGPCAAGSVHARAAELLRQDRIHRRRARSIRRST